MRKVAVTETAMENGGDWEVGMGYEFELGSQDELE